MKTKFITLGVGVLACAATLFAGPADAASYTGQSASAVAQDLTSRGYVVQFNQRENAPLSTCTVTGVDGLRGTTKNGAPHAAKGSTVYVDLNCEPDDDDD